MKQMKRLTLQCPPPRNPLVVPSLARKAGTHRLNGKAQRAKDKTNLRRLLAFKCEPFEGKQHGTMVFEMARH